MVIPVRREKGCRVAHALGDRKAEDTVLKGQRPLYIGYLQMDMPDARLRMNGFHGSHEKIRPERPLLLTLL